MPRYRDWTTQLHHTIKAASERPFSWGEFDCCLFAADCCIAICGVDPAAEYRGRYTTEIGAKRVLRNTHGSLEAAWDASFERVPAVTVKVSVALFDFYAAIFSTSLTTRRSGFSDTNVTGCQLRVSPLQRSGCTALAARLRACLLANMTLSSPVWRCIGVTKRIALWRCS